MPPLRAARIITDYSIRSSLLISLLSLPLSLPVSFPPPPLVSQNATCPGIPAVYFVGSTARANDSGLPSLSFSSSSTRPNVSAPRWTGRAIHSSSLSLSLYLYFSALTLSRFKSINRFLRNDPPPSFLSPEERREGAARFVTVTPHQRHNLRGYKTIKIEEDFIDARSPHNLFYYDRPSVGRRYPSQVNTLSVYEAARIRRVITERRGSVVEKERERERRGRRRRVIDSRYLNVSIKPALTHANFDPRLRCRNEASIFSDSQPVYKYFFRRRVSRIEWISDRETES